MKGHRIKFKLAVGILVVAVLIARAAPDAHVGLVVTPVAAGETDPVPSDGDAADDPAIWVHPTDPAQSLILGTDKRSALMVYDLSGKQLQAAGRGCEPNNVDVLYGFDTGDGRRIDLAAASARGPQHRGVKVWAIDPQRLRVEDVTDGGAIRVFGGSTPYGICTYHSFKSGRAYFFVTSADGHIEQHEMIAQNGKVAARKLRSLKLSSTTEGCVADDERGIVYFAEESRGIWRTGAEPDASSAPVLVAKVGENGLAADVEGLTIYSAAGGKGYLIASSQGKNVFKVYRRDGNNDFVCTIDPKKGSPPNSIGDVEDTDGIAVSNRPAGPKYSKGLLVAQDGHNEKRRQNFKIFRWEDIAGPAGLIVDTDWDPRVATGEPGASK
jgi:3-phytase